MKGILIKFGSAILGRVLFSLTKYMFLHPYLFIGSFFKTLFYYIAHRVELVRKLFYVSGKVSSETIVSLTTYNKRISTVYLTVESLMNQKTRPIRIVLWISKEDVNPCDLPLSINKLMERGLIVNFVEDNNKSYKKLSYVNLDDRNFTAIVTADDDVIYPSWWLSKLELESKKNPGSVICYRGHDIVYPDSNCPVFSYDYILSNQTELRKGPSSLILATGVSGILYPKESLDNRISDFKIINEICPDADDIWYYFIAISNGFTYKRVEDKNFVFPLILTSLHDGLQFDNVYNNSNDSKFIATCDYFKSNTDSERDRTQGNRTNIPVL